MKIIHIANDDKFTAPYIKFVNEHFLPSEHKFAIRQGKNNFLKISAQNMEYFKSNKNLLQLNLMMRKSEKIILHSLPEPKLLLLLSLQPKLLRKCYWVLWGADLYKYLSIKKNFKQKFLERTRARVIKNLKGIVTHVRGDYELAVSWYNTSSSHYYCFLYPSNLYQNLDVKINDKFKKGITIQVGNSADPTNNHLEIFKELTKFENCNIKVVSPLSYGKEQYARKVIAIGEKLFIENFSAITDFLPYQEYLDFLADVDIAIFNHNRQQALGNIITLLGLGKKVYIRDDITTWDFCKEHGLKVFSINEGITLEKLDEKTQRTNICNIKKYFSEQKLIEQWQEIFED